MKKLLIIILCLGTLNISAQNIGIGTTQPDNSAALHISDTSRGILIPRMTLFQRNKIQNPSEGLMIYQIDGIKGFWYFNGSEWNNVNHTPTSAVNSSGHNVIAFKNDTTFTVPNGVNSIVVEAWGGGAGGGGSHIWRGSYIVIGGGGGAGCYVKKTISVVPNQTYSITVGKGGEPGPDRIEGSTSSPSFSITQPGTVGGNSSFGNLLVVNGGTGGGGVNIQTGGAGGIGCQTSEMISNNGNSGMQGGSYGSPQINGLGGVNNSSVRGYLGFDSLGKGGDFSTKGTQGAVIIYY
jgi:hypothetical protein